MPPDHVPYNKDAIEAGRKNAVEAGRASRILFAGFQNRAIQLKAAGLTQVPALKVGNFPLSPSAVAAAEAQFRAEDMPELSFLHYFQAGRRLCDMAAEALGLEIPAALDAATILAISSPQVKSPLSNSVPLVEEIARAAERLSPGQRRLLTEFNLKTIVGRRLEEFDPDTARMQARGYDRNLTMDHGPAFFTPWQIAIVMLQEHKYYPAESAYIVSMNPYFYYLHECGHAVSTTCNEISEWGLLARAYEKDVARLETLPAGPAKPEKTPRVCTNADTLEPITGYPERCLDDTSASRRFNLRYFLEKAQGGAHVSARPARNEAVAELFAIRTSGVERPDFKLRETFPETAATLEKILAAVEREMTTTPDMEALLPVTWRDKVFLSPVPAPKLPGLPPAEKAPAPKPPQS